VAIANRSGSNVIAVDRTNASSSGDDTGVTTISAAAVTSVATSLTGAAGNDVITGGALNDTLSGAAGNDNITGGDGNDSMLGGDGIDIVTGGVGEDYIVGGNNGDVLTGGDGNDTFVFGSLSGTGNEITDFNPGTASSTGSIDRLAFDITGSGETAPFVASTATSALVIAGTSASDAGAAVGTSTSIVLTSVSSANANASTNASDAFLLTAGTSIILFQSDTGVTSASTLQSALALGQYGIDAGVMTNGTRMIALYDKGASLGVAIIAFSSATAETSASATATEIVELTGVSSLANINATDFIFV
jgi:Ca2+-binding RTX toxin-like protein